MVQHSYMYIVPWYKPAHLHLDSTHFNDWLIEYDTIQ